MVLQQETSLELRVNGETHQVTTSPDTPLLYVLRNELRLNAAKFGCGLGQCGACTVLSDGEPIRSCIVPVSEAAGTEITTVEGIGNAGNLHLIQQAFLDEQAAQCGYCIPGMMMTAAAFLEQNPQPTEEEIRTAMNANLCRCGTHVRILRAVQRAAELSSES